VQASSLHELVVQASACTGSWWSLPPCTDS